MKVDDLDYHYYMKFMPIESTEPAYTCPPIIEAVFEVRFSTNLTVTKLEKARDRIASRYDDSKVENQVEIHVDFNARQANFTDKPPIFRLTSSDQTSACTLSIGSLVWSRRAPYEGWNSFKEPIVAELQQILKSLNHPPVERLGLRYVNRIDVKLVDDLAHYEDYLNFKIQHKNHFDLEDEYKELLEPTTGYKWQLLKEFKDLGLSAIVQSGVVDPEIPRFASFSLDIDIFCNQNTPQDISSISEKMEVMRTLKNTIFEAGITDKARETYS